MQLPFSLIGGRGAAPGNARSRRGSPLREDSNTGCRLRFSRGSYGLTREKTVFHKYLQEDVALLLQTSPNISGSLREAYGRMYSRIPVLQLPLTAALHQALWIHSHSESEQYTRSPLEDSRLFGPSPWNILAATIDKYISEQPSPWRKSSKRESCYGDRVYVSVRMCGIRQARKPWYTLPLYYT